MKSVLLYLTLAGVTSAVGASETDLAALGKSYFAAWQATQSPNANQDDIEHYLSFLTEDVGHQHLPYDSDDARLPTGKADIRNGMGYYLGAHTSYASTLNQVLAAHNAVVISYSTNSSGIHPQSKEVVNLRFDTMEVLEIENGKVSVIRKYEE